MKHIYKINLWWIISTIILYVSTSILYLSLIGLILGYFFQIALGLIQLTSFSIYIVNWKKIAAYLKPYFIIYGVLTSLLIPYSYFVSSEVFINTLIGYSGILAIYFLVLSYKQYKYISV